MRVISGKFRGKKLLGFKGDDIRPTTDRVKENVFNIISAKIRGSVFLDLFSGTGAIGIEAVSCGAAETYFCDEAKESASLTQKNLASVGVSADSLLRCGFEEALKRLSASVKKFDFIYLDPPYASGFYAGALRIIEERDLLSEGGVAICESDAPVVFAGGLVKLDERKYGGTYIAFFGRAREEQI